jgi:hypothetical protein
MNPFRPSYVLFVGAGVLLALAFPVARHIPRERLRQQYYFLQGITVGDGQRLGNGVVVGALDYGRVALRIPVCRGCQAPHRIHDAA